MSERAAKLLKEDIASLGMVRLRDVDEAQSKMVVTTKDLAMRGEIMIPDSSGADEMVY
jgi:flagellar motor switch protein FliG